MFFAGTVMISYYGAVNFFDFFSVWFLHDTSSF